MYNIYIYIYIHSLKHRFARGPGGLFDTGSALLSTSFGGRIPRGVSLRANASPARALAPQSTDKNLSACGAIGGFRDRGETQNERAPRTFAHSGSVI